MIRVAHLARSAAVAVRLMGLAMLVPLAGALLLDPWNRLVLGAFELPSSALAFGLCIGLAASLWLPLHLAARRSTAELSDREAYVGVALAWLLAAGVASTPFLLLRLLPPASALFEAMSGLTGTGITALASLDAVPASLLLWRSFLHWAGGLALTILSISLLARLSHGGLLWMGPARSRWRLQEVALSVGGVYLVVTLAFAVATDLVLTFRHQMTGIPALAEALTQTFAAYGNGAFTLHAAPLFPDDPVLAALRSTMMLAGALNVPVAILLARRQAVRMLGGNPEVRFFLLVLAAGALAVTALSWRADPLAALQTAIAVGTNAGMAATPALPPAAELVLVLLAVTGGMVASPSGGITAYRALVLLKSIGRETRRLLHPKAVIPLRLGSRVVSEDAVLAIIAFFFTFVTAWVAGTVALTVLEPTLGMADSASGALAALANVAFGFGPLAAADGYAHLSAASQGVLTALMWLGRLEVFAALLVFMPSVWRR